MSMSRYDPFREAMSLRSVIDRLFEQSFVQPRLFGSTEAMLAPMDVYEQEQGYIVRMALPGVKPDDIDITLGQEMLTVRGRYSHDQEQPQMPQAQGQTGGQPSTTMQGKEQATQGNWIMREMQSGSFERSVTFARPIDPDHVETKFEHGVLTINLPVTQASRTRHISLSGGQGQSQQIPIEGSTEKRQGS